MQPIEKKKRLHKMKVGMLISRAAFLKMPAKTYQCSGTFVEITEQFFITKNGQPISGRDIDTSKILAGQNNQFENF